ncbi:TPA: CHAP domain-containing protein [Staphylococcus aureus]|uniref:CHAP domain-containing protein n=1 Tax=Staphylococcus TaxID=1279 RepID=UPI002903EE16|nr:MULTISPECIES: CHAP domain-containing protein [Staphylococcus]MDU0435902.1 CHAP domain-containing protein [Staphylococcus haemolyticus]MDU0463539.1 CHAP domain-containing protein [Staphylococcus ureilyticus]
MWSAIAKGISMLMKRKALSKIIKPVIAIVIGFFLLIFIMVAYLVGSFTKEINESGEQKMKEAETTVTGACSGGSVDGSGIATFEKNAKGGALEGKAKEMVKIAKKNKIPPKLFMAIVASESEWGKGANATIQKNPLSLMGAGPLQVFPSIEEGLDKGAKNLYDLYISEGLTTPKKIGPKYAPVGASNDPTNLNSNWVPTVTKIMDSLGGEEATCSISGGGSDGEGFDFKGEFPKPDKSKYNGISYPWGQCTWYVHQRRKEIGKPVPLTWGNGGDWGDNAKAQGWQVGSKPKAGAGASIKPGNFGAPAPYGHIMFVEKVKNDGGIIVSESNVKGEGVISYREFTKEETQRMQFIYDK